MRGGLTGEPRLLALALGGTAALAIVFGFFIQWATLTQLGPGQSTDALFAALAVPQIVIIVVSNPIGHVLVPLLATEDSATLEANAWSIVAMAGLGFGLLALVLTVSASFWVPLTVPGFSGEGRALAVRLARIQVWGMAAMGTGAVLRSVYHARHRFLWPASSAVVAAAVGLAYLAWRLPRDGVSAAAWTFTLRSGFEFVLLVPALRHFHRPTLQGAAIREFWHRLRPLLFGYAYERTEMVVDRVLASLAPAGGLSLLYLAQQVWGAVGQVVNRAVALPVTPRLAQLAAGGEWGRFQDLYRRRLAWVLVLTAACIAGLLAIGQPALGFVFGIRNVTSADVHLLWVLLLLLVGFLIGDPTSHLLLTSFYTTGDTATPTWIGIIVYTFGIVLKLGGFYVFGLVGLAGGTSLYWLLRSTVLWLVLRRRTAPLAAAHPA